MVTGPRTSWQGWPLNTLGEAEAPDWMGSQTLSPGPESLQPC